MAPLFFTTTRATGLWSDVKIPAKLWSFIIKKKTFKRKRTFKRFKRKKHLNVVKKHLNVVIKHLNVKKSGVHLLETHTYIVGYGNSKEKPNRICKHC